MSSPKEEEEAKKSFNTWTFKEPHTKPLELTPLPEISLEISESSSVSVEAAREKHGWIVVGVYAATAEEEKELKLDESLDDDGTLADLLKEDSKGFAKLGACTPTIRVVKDKKTTRYTLLHLGKKSSSTTSPGHKIGTSIASLCAEITSESSKITSIGVVLPSNFPTSNITDISCAFYSGLYIDNRFKSTPKPLAVGIRSVTLYSSKTEGDVEAGKAMSRGMNLCRDIVNAPHNVMNSVCLAETAKALAQEFPDVLSCRVLGVAECEERGMGSFLAVGRGSETEPQFIHLTYKPPLEGEDKHVIGIVGKGVLFDTGGYNIKTAMMELMKFDCGGAAAAIGAAKSIAMLKPNNVEVHFIVAATENMISDRAYVPSDILTASNGKTIEVMNTDAEGRLTMADALVYADKECKCTSIVELSTLTGACMVALGKLVAGMWTTEDTLAQQLQTASAKSDDRIWRMPMVEEYRECMESKIADIKNLGDRWGGAIHAALFLTNFVTENKAYAHVDIAGPTWDDKKAGATGFGVKLLSQWVSQLGME